MRPGPSGPASTRRHTRSDQTTQRARNQGRSSPRPDHRHVHPDTGPTPKDTLEGRGREEPRGKMGGEKASSTRSLYTSQTRVVGPRTAKVRVFLSFGGEWVAATNARLVVITGAPMVWLPLRGRPGVGSVGPSPPATRPQRRGVAKGEEKTVTVGGWCPGLTVWARAESL